MKKKDVIGIDVSKRHSNCCCVFIQ